MKYRIEFLADDYQVYAMAHELLLAVHRRNKDTWLATGGSYKHPEQKVLEDEIKKLRAILDAIEVNP